MKRKKVPDSEKLVAVNLYIEGKRPMTRRVATLQQFPS